MHLFSMLSLGAFATAIALPDASPSITMPGLLSSLLPPPALSPPPFVAEQAFKPTKTVVLVPTVLIPEPVPNSPFAAETSILPFHLQVTEYCENGARKAKGVYKNGPVAEFPLPAGQINAIDHGVGGFPPVRIGPFDYMASKVRFEYKNCVWYDDETWKSCGECRAGMWSGGPLNCVGGSASRTKHMDCSFILGIKDIQVAEDRPGSIIQSITARDLSEPEGTPELIPELENFDPTTTSSSPNIIMTAASPAGPVVTILTFSLDITEFCKSSSYPAVIGWYESGSLTFVIHHLHPQIYIDIPNVDDYPPMKMRYNINLSRAEFAYKDCYWHGDETWRRCGECRAGQWSRQPLNCKEEKAMRWKRMDCSFVLGESG